MRRIFLLITVLLGSLTACRPGPDAAAVNQVAGEITWLASTPLLRGRPSLMVRHGGTILYVDPAGLDAIETLPKADILLVTHDDPDHFDARTLRRLRKPGTLLIANRSVTRTMEKDWNRRLLYEVTPGDLVVREEVTVEAVPMYREFNTRQHPRRAGYTGYIVTLDTVRVYFSGSIGVMPELKAMRPVHIACLNVRCQDTPIPGEDYLESVGGDSYTLDERETLEVLGILKPAVFIPVYWLPNQREAMEALAARVSPEIRVILAPP